KSPPHSPKANAICERAIGTIRRECLDWLIPMSELHLRSVLKVWVTHYNGASAHGIGSGCSRSAIRGLAIVDSALPASDRRALGAARQIDTGRLASRVFARARTRLIELLRMTALRRRNIDLGRNQFSSIRGALM